MVIAMQIMSNGFNTFKMNDSIHVQMLIIQEIFKNSLICSNINMRHQVVMFFQYILVNAICNIQMMVLIYSK
jgi:hypothetical protein